MDLFHVMGALTLPELRTRLIGLLKLSPRPAKRCFPIVTLML